MRMNVKKSSVYALILLLVLSLADMINPAFADEDVLAGTREANPSFSIYIDQPTIQKGYTVTAFDDALKLSLVPGILSEDTRVDILELDEPLPMPWRLSRISPVYQFEFRNKAAYNDHKPFYIQFSYPKDSNDLKRVYFYDKNYNAWRPLPTRDFPKEHFVRSLIHLPYARIAVFSDSEAMAMGQASWYGYKGGNFAASPDYPKGSRLRVYNHDESKFVDVEINDFGPDRRLHPERVIDLDKAAFEKLAPLGAGVIDVRIEPLYIVPDSNGRELGVADTGMGTEPEINVKAAIVMNEKSGEVYYTSAPTTTLPLASLSKMIAVSVFLDTDPELDKVVTYMRQDEEYNYEHCKEWESSKLRIEEGETLSVENLIYVSLVGSTNNTIETLVRVSGLKRDDFIAKMNQTVKEWGATSTRFIEPTGLAPENVSSAMDYAIITKEVMKHPIIQKASTMKEYDFSTINKQVKHRIKNTNYLISTNQYDFTGSKTGYLDEAGYCLMSRVKAANGNNIIIVTLGASTKDMSLDNNKKLIDFGLRKAEEKENDKIL